MFSLAGRGSLLLGGLAVSFVRETERHHAVERGACKAGAGGRGKKRRLRSKGTGSGKGGLTTPYPLVPPKRGLRLKANGGNKHDGITSVNSRKANEQWTKGIVEVEGKGGGRASSSRRYYGECKYGCWCIRKARIPPSTLVDPCYRGPLIHQMH